MCGVSLYVHVPFCRSRCRYCDFYSCVIEGEEGSGLYMEALERCLDRIEDQAPFATIYVGGGTPSALPERDFLGLLERLAPLLAPGGEWSMEANPESLDPVRCRAMQEAGVTRLSLGVQSLRDDQRQWLGRALDGAGTLQALELARREGPPHLSADIILGLPGQDRSDLEDLVDRLAGVGVDHISHYLLTVEEGTPLADLLARGAITSLPDQEEQAAQLLACRELLDRAGLAPYEISNSARPGCECRHNLRYWQGGDYIGLGPSASSFLSGVRSRNISHLNRWAEAVRREESLLEQEERLDPDRAAGERAWLMLRTTAGLDLARVEELTGCSKAWLDQAHRALDLFRAQGLVIPRGKGFSLTEEGVLQGDGVGLAFLGGDY